MRENRANKSYSSRLIRWVDRLLPFDFTIHHLPGSKLGLVDYVSQEPLQTAVNNSVYDEQFVVAKLDAIKRSTKRSLLNVENYIDFAARNPLIKQASNTPHSSYKLCKEFAPRNREFSAITENDNTISKLTQNKLNSYTQIENANIPHPLFALNQSTNQSNRNLNNFQQVLSRFQDALMMSSSDEVTLMHLKYSTPSKVRFADEAGPSTALSVPATPSTRKHGHNNSYLAVHR